MKLRKEKEIIEKAVNQAMHPDATRDFVWREAVAIADKNGVNVAQYPYLHDYFCEVLDRYTFIPTAEDLEAEYQKLMDDLD